MKNNPKAAVSIIVGLSLLLGLSLGHIQHQYQEMQALKSKPSRFNESAILLEIPKWRQHTKHAIQLELQSRRAEIEAIKQIMRLEREEQLRELRTEVERVKAMYQR